jgi:hypothetical protein
VHERAGSSSPPKPKALSKPRTRPKEGVFSTIEPSEVLVQPVVPTSAATPNAVTSSSSFAAILPLAEQRSTVQPMPIGATYTLSGYSNWT